MKILCVVWKFPHDLYDSYLVLCVFFRQINGAMAVSRAEWVLLFPLRCRCNITYSWAPSMVQPEWGGCLWEKLKVFVGFHFVDCGLCFFFLVCF